MPNNSNPHQITLLDIRRNQTLKRFYPTILSTIETQLFKIDYENNYPYHKHEIDNKDIETQKEILDFLTDYNENIQLNLFYQLKTLTPEEHQEIDDQINGDFISTEDHRENNKHLKDLLRYIARNNYTDYDQRLIRSLVLSGYRYFNLNYLDIKFIDELSNRMVTEYDYIVIANGDALGDGLENCEFEDFISRVSTSKYSPIASRYYTRTRLKEYPQLYGRVTECIFSYIKHLDENPEYLEECLGESCPVMNFIDEQTDHLKYDQLKRLITKGYFTADENTISNMPLDVIFSKLQFQMKSYISTTLILAQLENVKNINKLLSLEFKIEYIIQGYITHLSLIKKYYDMMGKITLILGDTYLDIVYGFVEYLYDEKSDVRLIIDDDSEEQLEIYFKNYMTTFNIDSYKLGGIGLLVNMKHIIEHITGGVFYDWICYDDDESDEETEEIERGQSEYSLNMDNWILKMRDDNIKIKNIYNSQKHLNHLYKIYKTLYKMSGSDGITEKSIIEYGDIYLKNKEEIYTRYSVDERTEGFFQYNTFIPRCYGDHSVNNRKNLSLINNIIYSNFDSFFDFTVCLPRMIDKMIEKVSTLEPIPLNYLQYIIKCDKIYNIQQDLEINKSLYAFRRIVFSMINDPKIKLKIYHYIRDNKKMKWLRSIKPLIDRGEDFSLCDVCYCEDIMEIKTKCFYCNFWICPQCVSALERDKCFQCKQSFHGEW